MSAARFEQKPLRLFLLAGEASGDRLGADLISRLQRRTSVELLGVGGTEMSKAGLCSLFPMSDLSVMGLADVLKNLPRLLWRLGQTERAILNFNPDIVVLIDSQEFSALLAKRLKRNGFSQPMLLYVAPTVWVYKPERAPKLNSLFDEVLAILPFEPAVMERLSGPPTSFVGHPAQQGNPAAAGIASGNKVALFPGSRLGELKRHLPMFAQVAKKLHSRHPEIEFFVPTLPHLESRMRRRVLGWQVPLTIVTGHDQRKHLLQETRLAVVVSGTATLELAFAGVPMVVTYVMDFGQGRVREKLDFNHISLPNIILNEPLLPELLFKKADPASLLAAVEKLLSNSAQRQRQLAGFQRMADLMARGTSSYPRQNPADRVLSHLLRR